MASLIASFFTNQHNGMHPGARSHVDHSAHALLLWLRSWDLG
jgi:hypothetical protein